LFYHSSKIFIVIFCTSFSTFFLLPFSCFLTRHSDTSSFLSKFPFSSHPIIWHSHKNELSLDIERENKEAFFMSKKLIKVGIGLGLLALGAAYLGKKTGLFEDDSHLYDEFESI